MKTNHDDGSKRNLSKPVKKRGIQTKHSTSSNHKLKKKKAHNPDNSNSPSNKHFPHSSGRSCHPLNGITIAISTLNTGMQHEKKEDSYKYVVNECKAAGAAVSGQVGKKVFAVVCNRSAVLQCTQRVRKAVKKNVMLVDIEWVRESVIRGKRLDCQDYLLDDLANDIIKEKEMAMNDTDATTTTNGASLTNTGSETFDIMDEINTIPTTGWSEPVSVGCCCVCHENGDKNCKWCTSPLCNINAKLCVVVEEK